MELSEIKKEKLEAERKIARAIVDALALFSRRTGLPIKDIRINMQEVTSLSDIQKQYILGLVSCEVDYD